MATSVSLPIFDPPTSAVYALQAPTPVSPAPKTAADSSTDSVKLSQTAEIHFLNGQGQSASQIATSLSISVATVDDDLGITVTAAPASPAPVAAKSAPAPKPATAAPVKTAPGKAAAEGGN